MPPIDASIRILMLHYIVFRCIPVALRNVLVSKARDKFGITLSGSWLLKNVSGLPRFQHKTIRYKHVSKWDASLLCKILLYSNLHLLTEQIPPSDYKILSPNVLEITNESTAWKTCLTDKDFQTVIVQQKFGSTRLVAVDYATMFTDTTLKLKLSQRILVPTFRFGQIHVCSQQWIAVREMGVIRNQHAHRPNEKVSMAELVDVTNKMNNALKLLNITPCENVKKCICFKSL